MSELPRPTAFNRATIARNPHLFGNAALVPHDDEASRPVERVIVVRPKAVKRIRQDSKPLMNGLEREWLMREQASQPGTLWHAQAWRVKLGNGAWFKVDFIGLPTNLTRWQAHEVKGPKEMKNVQRQIDKLKIAASLWPEVDWWLNYKQNGGWNRERVLP